MPHNKIANAFSVIFAVMFALLIALQIGIILFSNISVTGKIITGILSLIFILVIAFLIIERKKEPPIKY